MTGGVEDWLPPLEGEQYCSPLCDVSGRTRRGVFVSSVKVSVSLVDECLLPDWHQPNILLQDCMTCAGERMVSVACG
jgi:hypothetical protein